MVIRSEEHITSLLLQGQLLIDRWLTMFGTGLFPQKCPYLCGASFVTDCLLKIIWQGGESFKQQTNKDTFALYIYYILVFLISVI